MRGMISGMTKYTCEDCGKIFLIDSKQTYIICRYCGGTSIRDEVVWDSKLSKNKLLKYLKTCRKYYKDLIEKIEQGDFDLYD